MAEDTEDSTLRDYVIGDSVSSMAGVDRAALREWVRAGLLPRPQWTGGRGALGKWPRVSLKIAAFVRGQRELGFGLQDIRARIVADERLRVVLPKNAATLQYCCSPAGVFSEDFRR
jgi:DNA-binding transcriptional MerR regulator